RRDRRRGSGGAAGTPVGSASAKLITTCMQRTGKEMAMGARNFRQLLQNQWRRDRMICGGLDPDWGRIPPALKTRGGMERDPAQVVLDFTRTIIDATCDVAGTYKPQSAFYEKWGAAGQAVLERTIEYLDQAAPDTPRILDAKRADAIDRVNRAYVEAVFGHLG